MKYKVIWQDIYSDTEQDDKFGRWMRIGRIHGLTVAIMSKAKGKYKYRCEVPNLDSSESIQSALFSDREEELKGKVNLYIDKYINRLNGNYKRTLLDKMREENEIIA